MNYMFKKEKEHASESKSVNNNQHTAQKRLQQSQAQVDEVVDIMRVNVEKFLERDQKVSELDNRSKALVQCASSFEQQTAKLKQKHRKANMRMMVIMGVICAVMIVFFIFSLVRSYKHN